MGSHRPPGEVVSSAFPSLPLSLVPPSIPSADLHTFSFSPPFTHSSICCTYPDTISTTPPPPLKPSILSQLIRSDTPMLLVNPLPGQDSSQLLSTGRGTETLPGYLQTQEQTLERDLHLQGTSNRLTKQRQNRT
ncbi:hypothetical protein GDO81_009065 [Engystomops pustulosus]|uniref:Uncharacterized protein n=1 Tax=Engystomops pustulosus TaxID=76066 RepID=A0AAV7BNN6_ENGPU|nr:hypothetical protein GDO81_009065 [Engystomops pustulosus]